MQKSVGDRNESKTRKRVGFLPDIFSPNNDPIDTVKYYNSDTIHGKQNQLLKSQRSSNGVTVNHPQDVDIFKSTTAATSKLFTSKQTSEKTSFRHTRLTFKLGNSPPRASRLKVQTKYEKRNKSKPESLSSVKSWSNVEVDGDSADQHQTSGKSKVVSNNIRSMQTASLTTEENRCKKTPVQARAHVKFETQIKMSDGLTTNTTRQMGTRFRASDHFYNVLSDFYGNPKAGNATRRKPRARNVVIYATRFVVKVHKRRTGLEVKGKRESRYSNKVNVAVTDQAKTAKGCWEVLRRSILDKKSASQSHEELRHPLDGLPGLEYIRNDLYERYGVIPRRRSDGTLVQENVMMSDRAKSLVVSHSNNKALGSRKPVDLGKR